MKLKKLSLPTWLPSEIILASLLASAKTLLLTCDENLANPEGAREELETFIKQAEEELNYRLGDFTLEADGTITSTPRKLSS